MKPQPKTLLPADVRAQDPSLSSAERSELQRQGAKAAARGEPAATNPLLEAENKPPATGESPGKWSQRSAAWEQGHQSQSKAQREDVPAGRTTSRRTPR